VPPGTVALETLGSANHGNMAHVTGGGATLDRDGKRPNVPAVEIRRDGIAGEDAQPVIAADARQRSRR